MELNKGSTISFVLDKIAAWTRIKRLVEHSDFIEYFNRATENEKNLVSQAIKDGRDKDIKDIFNKWVAKDWRKKKVHELRVVAAAYRIPNASVLGRDFLVKALEKYLDESVGNSEAGTYRDLGEGI